MFITFEGIDGAGKTTQINLLKDYLENQGKSVLTIREPGGLAFSEKIRDILLDNNTNINKITELFLFESARSELTEKVILPALNHNKIVICDRFFDSTTAYQGFGRGLNIEEVLLINRFATQKLTPNITFYLKIPIKTSLNRNINKIKDRMESNSNEFIEKVKNGFDTLAEMYPERIKIIKADEEIINVHHQILKYFEN
jgi:dTMP kinase